MHRIFRLQPPRRFIMRVFVCSFLISVCLLSTGTTSAVAQALVAQALDDPVLRDNFNKASMETIGGPPEQLGRLARADSDKYARLVKELNITAD